MTQENVNKVIARLLTDDSFATKFLKNPAAVLKKEGITVTEDELQVLSKIKKGEITAYRKERKPIQVLKG